MIKCKIFEGSCGKAAGSEILIKEFEKFTQAENIEKPGCIGMCHYEALVEVYYKGQYTLFRNVTEKDVLKIITGLTTDRGIESSIEIKIVATGKDSFTENYKNISDSYLKQQTRIALRNIGIIDPMSIDSYKAKGVGVSGYKVITDLLKNKTEGNEIINILDRSGLRGRGGAGFKTSLKWHLAKENKATQKYVIINGDEGDPGAFMDRSLLEGDPHSVLEGLMIAAYTIGANFGYAYIRAEYPLAIKNFKKAIDDAKKAKLLGENILGSNFSFDIKIKEGAGAFVCGEETALIASIEGERGMPKLRPPYPPEKGLFNYPTVINNVETLAQIPWIIANIEQFTTLGTPQSRGTKVFALAGNITRGGLVEIPMGTTIRKVIYDIGGGPETGYKVKGVQLGGPSGGCLPDYLLDTPITYEDIQKTGAIIGSGGMIVFDERTCMVDLAKYFLDFTEKESCGKCTFCRIGTLRMKEILEKITRGYGVLDDITKLESLAKSIKETSLCGLGQSAPNPVLTTLEYFMDEYLEHIEQKVCRGKRCKALIEYFISPDRCTACNLCSKSCPANAIIGKTKEKGSYKVQTDKCIKCGVCKDVCKFNAVDILSKRDEKSFAEIYGKN